LVAFGGVAPATLAGARRPEEEEERKRMMKMKMEKMNQWSASSRLLFSFI
jgi:RecA/RadA recombinase